jgi:putative transposase
VSAESESREITIKRLCERAGLSRQAFYKGERARRRREVDQGAVVELVRRERALQPRLGGRKLRVVIGAELEEMNVRVGRDRFFEILRAKNLLVEPLRRAPRTTDSAHGFRKWPNLVRHVEPTMAHQVWVGDLTYVRTEEGFLYLSLLTDGYSRKIVGHHASDTLEVEGCLKTLKQALGQLPEAAWPIHHTDRGVQYCCRDYMRMLSRRGLAVSMTEENHCYENAKAERVNGILKTEYGLSRTFRTKALALEAIGQAVALYNERRPHQALSYRTPTQVHALAA